MPVMIRLPRGAKVPSASNDCPKCGWANVDQRFYCRHCATMLPRGKERGIPASWSLDKFKQARKDLFTLYDPTPSNICYGDGYYANSLVTKYGMSTSELMKIVGTPKFNTTWSWT